MYNDQNTHAALIRRIDLEDDQLEMCHRKDELLDEFNDVNLLDLVYAF